VPKARSLARTAKDAPAGESQPIAGEDSVPDGAARNPSGGVQSIERAFELLEMLADAGASLSLSELSAISGLPLPTVHRLMRTLVNQGYVRQEPSRRYSLGPRLIHLGEVSGRLLGTWLRPHLVHLVTLTNETANLAMLDGDDIVYIARASSLQHQMQMFSEPGRRALAHCTAVGKALLAQLPPDDARAILKRSGMPRITSATITDPDLLLAHLEVIRRQGYAVDEGEQEIGVRCFAVPLTNTPSMQAISVSGPVARMTGEAAQRIVPSLLEVAREISERIATEGQRWSS
jgi:IclR family transcriptional regulator, acetate operon repressor